MSKRTKKNDMKKRKTRKRGKKIIGGEKITYKDESFYEGDVFTSSNNKKLRYGKGVMKYNNGDVYNGDWILDNKSGEGVMTYKDGTKHKGKWRENKKYGKFIFIYPHGTYTEQEWNDDKQIGEDSELIYYFDNKIQGNKNIMYDINGDKYKGEWASNFKDEEKKDYKPEGKGRMIYKNGDIYEGYWKQGKKEGIGKITYAYNKSTWEGNWYNDKKNGQGIIFYENGTTLPGEWKDNQIINNNQPISKQPMRF